MCAFFCSHLFIYDLNNKKTKFVFSTSSSAAPSHLRGARIKLRTTPSIPTRGNGRRAVLHESIAIALMTFDRSQTCHRHTRFRQTPSPLPPLPERDVLTAEQVGILSAVADTVIPSFTSQEGNRLLQHPLRNDIYEASCRRLEQGEGLEGAQDLAKSYLAESAWAQKDFRDGLTRLVNIQLHEEARKQLLFILNALG